jgi:hypothetical protein
VVTVLTRAQFECDAGPISARALRTAAGRELDRTTGALVTRSSVNRRCARTCRDTWAHECGRPSRLLGLVRAACEGCCPAG